MLPFAYLNVKAIEDLLYEEAVTSADNISETIIKTTHYQMLENDRERVYQMMLEAGSQEDIEHIRMITKDGQIIFSTNVEEEGKNLDKNASACDMCHSASRPLEQASTMNRSRVFLNGEGEEVLGITKAIYNQKSCYTAPCHFHPADLNILGVLDTVVSLDRVREKTAEYTQRLIFLTLSMLFAIGASITLLIHHQVSRPIKKLLGHTRRVGELDLSARIEDTGKDEIGELARSFNDMTQKLDLSQQELEAWGHTLESKVEQRTREVELMQSQIIRAEKLASLGEIVAGIAHELNNPLTGILVLSSLIEKEGQLEGCHREDIQSIVRESQRCAKIVKGLLDFSRVSAPKMAPCDINQIIENTLTLIGSQSIFHNIVIKKNYDANLPLALADSNQLEQVFINIVLNSGQAIDGEGVIGITTKSVGGKIKISISDNGVGISEEHLGKIFDPFFTTKENKGTGLGLSVSYGIIENHGGSINVSSVRAEGTTFDIYIPAA
ncbi:MAG: two-component sensor histidine kinase [Deltaproteobacteria bacterium]|nr:MAG: two-component sensor histidine kinase [Deltaproteobacteria bacterium]